MTNAIGRISTSGYSDVLCVLFRRDGQIADFTNNNWKAFSADAGTDTIAATEIGVSGLYSVNVPLIFQPHWWFAAFFRATKTSLCLAICENPDLALFSNVEGVFTQRDVARLSLALSSGNIVPGSTADEFHIKSLDGNTNRITFTRNTITQARMITARNTN